MVFCHGSKNATMAHTIYYSGQQPLFKFLWGLVWCICVYTSVCTLVEIRCGVYVYTQVCVHL